MTRLLYTDGACIGNPGPGGWAWVIPGERYDSGCGPDETNQRMELQAVLEGLRATDGEVEVVSDSTYVTHCFRDGWWQNWLRRDWRNANKRPVANRDLWEPLIALYQQRSGQISFRWVKGHSGDEYNEIADQLANEAARTQRSHSGRCEPPAAR